MAYSTRKMNKDTSEKKEYLKYYKKQGKSAQTYGQWKKARKLKGSHQHRTGMQTLDRTTYSDVMRVMKGK